MGGGAYDGYYRDIPARVRWNAFDRHRVDLRYFDATGIQPGEIMTNGGRFKFLHAADIHLDSPLRSIFVSDPAQAGRMRRASRDAFEKLVDAAIEHKVAFVVLAGDLYDHDVPNMQVAVFLRAQLLRLEKERIRVAIVKGNHDADNRITSGLPLPANTHVFSDRTAETIFYEDLPVRVAVHGQSFQPGPVPDNLAATYPAAIPNCFNLGVLHTSLAGSTEHDPYAPCKLEDLTTRDYDYWALGHIHKGRVLSRDPWVVYPGNLQGRHAKETGSKGCVVVTVEDGRAKDVENLDLAVVIWQVAEIDLVGAEDERTLIERLRAAMTRCGVDTEGRPVALRIRFVGSTSLFDLIEGYPRRILQTALETAGEVGGDDLWIERILNETSPLATSAGGGDDSGTDFFPILDEIGTHPENVTAALKGELEALRAKLPEDLKKAASFKLLDDPEEMLSALAKLKPKLRARLRGKDESR